MCRSLWKVCSVLHRLNGAASGRMRTQAPGLSAEIKVERPERDGEVSRPAESVFSAAPIECCSLWTHALQHARPHRHVREKGRTNGQSAPEKCVATSGQCRVTFTGLLRAPQVRRLRAEEQRRAEVHRARLDPGRAAGHRHHVRRRLAHLEEVLVAAGAAATRKSTRVLTVRSTRATLRYAKKI